MTRTAAVALAAALAAGPALGAGAPSIESVLDEHEGKAVTVHLDDGTELSGKVAGRSAVTVRLTELRGKEFYEAVIRLDRVAAVTIRSKGK